KEGKVWVVDLDLEKFFDQVNHDILMSKIAKRIDDKRVLKLIRSYLRVGMMQDGVSTQRQAGTPQGSPLSPLLSNIMLDELDKELEKRGHSFCRYADDCNIYVESKRAGERVMKSISEYLERRLKLKVNTEKSCVSTAEKRKFLGYRLRNNGKATVAPESIQRLKDKVRVLTQRNRGVNFMKVIAELNQALRGWLNYFRLNENSSTWDEIDRWIRKKLRCYRLKQRKRARSTTRWLVRLGVQEDEARTISTSGKGWWRLAQTKALHQAMNKKWFKHQGLFSLEDNWKLWVKA
ncbi:MAG: reverse transcriptase domain-containing protein, partial [Polynucleobacter sp.]|nr:reverse transcriptase domain-containing protein [Polynucleobacter sp.]